MSTPGLCDAGDEAQGCVHAGKVLSLLLGIRPAHVELKQRPAYICDFRHHWRSQQYNPDKLSLVTEMVPHDSPGQLWAPLGCLGSVVEGLEFVF